MVENRRPPAHPQGHRPTTKASPMLPREAAWPKGHDLFHFMRGGRSQTLPMPDHFPTVHIIGLRHKTLGGITFRQGSSRQALLQCSQLTES